MQVAVRPPSLSSVIRPATYSLVRITLLQESSSTLYRPACISGQIAHHFSTRPTNASPLSDTPPSSQLRPCSGQSRFPPSLVRKQPKRAMVSAATGGSSLEVATVNEEALEAATSTPTPDSSDEPFKLLQTETEHLPLAYHHLKGESPGLMFLPGFMSNMTSGKAMALEAHARKSGREYVRFDYHGHGSSGGRFEECTLGGWIENVLDILDKVTSGGPMVLVGSSMGMWIAIHVALRRPDRVAGLVGIGAAPDFLQRFWLTLSAEERESFEKDKLLLKQSPYSDEPYKISLDLITEARQHLLLNNAENSVAIDCPIRLLHGCKDVTAPPHLSSDIMNMVTSTDVEVTLVKDGDHRLSTPKDLDRMVRTVEELMRTIEAKQAQNNN